MRGADSFTESLFTMRRLEDFVPKSHPLRSIREMANEALVELAGLYRTYAQRSVESARFAVDFGWTGECVGTVGPAAEGPQPEA